MDVDVLLFGGDHRFQAYELEGKFFCNPGSATGAMSTGWLEDGEEVVPSFCLMDVSLLPIAAYENARLVPFGHADWSYRFKEMCLFSTCIN